MLDEIKKPFTSQLLITLLILAVGLYLFQIAWQFLANFSDVIIILVSAWILGFILEPLVERTSKLIHTTKPVAAFIVYGLFLGLIAAAIFIFIPQVTVQIERLLPILPRYFTNSPQFINHWINNVAQYFDNSLPLISSVAQFFFDLFIVIIISFYLVVDKERINKELYHMIPKKWHHHTHFVQTLINTTFASFLRVQLIFGILAGLTTWIVLRAFGIDFADSSALLAGILTMVPLIGPVLGLIPPLLVAFITDPTKAVIIFIILLVLQQVIFNIYGPRLMSKAFKLHPIIILLSFLIGYKIAGGAGAIFAIPVFGIATVIIREISHHFLESEKV